MNGNWNGLLLLR